MTEATGGGEVQAAVAERPRINWANNVDLGRAAAILNHQKSQEVDDLDDHAAFEAKDKMDALDKGAGKAYGDEIDRLRETGFTFCQAKLIMDLREESEELRELQYQGYIDAGLSPVEAKKATDDIFERADKTRRETIKYGGAFTHEDYERLSRGEDPSWYAGLSTNGEEPEAETPEAEAPAVEVQADPVWSAEVTPEDSEEPWWAQGLGLAELSDSPSVLPDPYWTPQQMVFDAAEQPETPIQNSASALQSGWWEQVAKGNELLGLPVTLDQAREAYVDLTARRRRVSLFSGKASLKKLAEARGVYEDKVDSMLLETGTNAAWAEQDAKVVVLEKLKDEAYTTEWLIRVRREELAKGNKLNKFYDWWAQQGKAKHGWLKKAGVMVGIGATTGLAVGAVVGTAGLGLIGSAITAAGARGITRGLAKAKITKGSDETVALKQGQTESRAIEASLNAASNNSRNGILGASAITERIDRNTSDEYHRNRKRMLGSVALGAGFAIAGGAALHLIHEAVSSGSSVQTSHTPRTTHDQQPAPKPQPQPNPASQPSTPNHTPANGSGSGQLNNSGTGSQPQGGAKGPGKGFNVEQGSGIIREVQEYAATQHEHISDVRASQIYEHLHERFGSNIINLDGNGPSTYSYFGDVRLTHTGMAHWATPDVRLVLDNELAKAA